MSTSNLKSSKWGKTSALSDLDKIRIECGVDENFRKQFLSDPKSVLEKHGVDVPDGLKIKVNEDTADTYNISIPQYRGNDLSNAALEKSARDKSGTTWCTTCTTTTPICIGSLASLTCA
ncbi:NHLP leader peptide family RiPP precursor [Aquimarina brevivitae]|uniref:Putative ribosomally synthesized peptide n=1 Tax=Aquimarina brevivitae TaxID=323412 RepID=A0A4Q7P537_9FLAO|nr:NHLP leader peptide family RiPP precursor [Aquimarina brevivitae]RZS93822.1 putative ribosomally synthesized peptide [Aquimarina brevivitae]